MEANTELVLRAGGSSVTLNDAGIFMDGPSIELNCGGTPGNGTPARPLLPEGSIAPEIPPPPIVHCLTLASQNAACVCEVCHKPTERNQA